MPDTRQMPGMQRIVDHWRGHADELPNLRSHWIGWGEPFCFACGWLPPVADGRRDSWRCAGAWLDRAHLHDHANGGTAEPDNLVPLCHLCHGVMPADYTDRADALAWVDQYPYRAPWWQMWTDEALRGCTPSRPTTLLRARMRYQQVLLTEYAALGAVGSGGFDATAA